MFLINMLNTMSIYMQFLSLYYILFTGFHTLSYYN
jgi:hypothetical protein